MTDVIDMHTHLLRDAHHGREVRRYLLADRTISPEVSTTGTMDEALGMMQATGVTRANLLMFTWTGRYYRDGLYTLPDHGDLDAADFALRTRVIGRMIDNNTWAEQTADVHPNWTWFCGIDPVLMTEAQVIDELEARLDGTAVGVVLMPQDLGIRCSDRRLFPVYDLCSRRGVPIVMGVSSAAQRFGRPDQLAPVLKAFPTLRVILSRIGDETRFGGSTDEEIVTLAQEFPQVHVDTAMRMADIARGLVTSDQVVAHIRAIGSDRVTYGSGYCFNELVQHGNTAGRPDGAPRAFGNTVSAVETLLSLPLTRSERSLVAGQTFLDLISA